MSTILSLREKFQQLQRTDVITEAAQETTGQFEDVQREQLTAGKTSKGDTIAPRYRSKSYAARKAAINPIPGLGVPDLKLTGSFQRLIDVEANKDVFDIISKDEKGAALENKYPDIFGLGGNYKAQYIGILGNAVRQRIANITGLKF